MAEVLHLVSLTALLEGLLGQAIIICTHRKLLLVTALHAVGLLKSRSRTASV